MKRLFGGGGSESGQDESPVYYARFDGDMDAAGRAARETFKYFWREMSWEQRRIVPACSVAAVKAPFADDGDLRGDSAEHMWIATVDFDGRRIAGEVLNQPRALESVALGDRVELPLERISDWMYASRGRVCGAFTVSVIRASMDRRARAAHDAAWGLDFGDPAAVQLVPGGDGWGAPDGEHPMSINMARAFAERAPADIATLRDDRGWTQLHRHALAGNTAMIDALLAAGADAQATTPEGETALALASRVGWWPAVIERLRAAAASSSPTR